MDKQLINIISTLILFFIGLAFGSLVSWFYTSEYYKAKRLDEIADKQRSAK